MSRTKFVRVAVSVYMFQCFSSQALSCSRFVFCGSVPSCEGRRPVVPCTKLAALCLGVLIAGRVSEDYAWSNSPYDSSPKTSFQLKAPLSSFTSNSSTSKIECISSAAF